MWCAKWLRWATSTRTSGGCLRASAWSLLLPGCTFALAVLYFGAGLGAREVSLLEAQDLGIASELFDSYALSVDHSPLHFVFLNLWQRLNSSSIAFLRAPSVLFCALAVAIVFSLARRLAGLPAGALSAFFLATNPEVVDAARSLRLYSLVILLAACSAWFAHAYLTRSTRRGYLLGFTLSVIVAIYTHLFAWLMACSFALLVGIDLVRHRHDKSLRWRTAKYLGVATLVLAPQIVHGFVASEMVRGRHALYSGISAHPLAFLVSVARTLFFGELESSIPLGNGWLLAPLSLLLVGVCALGKRGAVIAVALFVPTLFIAWWLSRTSQVEARYVCFLMPGVAAFMGVGATRGPTARYLAPVVLTVFWLSRFATAQAYDIPGTDWYELGAKLEQTRARGDVVAVFPGYFAPTFRRYTHMEDLVPVTFPSDLQRVLARRKRVLLVVNGGRYFGNIDAYLALRARGTMLFESQVRDTLKVLSIPVRRPNAGATVVRNPESLLFTGVMGSGGFPWQADSSERRPFARLKALLSGSRFVFADFEPYHPQRLARFFIGGSEARGLVVGPGIASTLRNAGFSHVLLDGGDPDWDPDSRVLEAAGLHVVAKGAGEGRDAVRVLRLGMVGIALCTLTDDEFRAGAKSSRTAALLARARASVGDSGRLLAVFRAPADYSRLPTAAEQAAARQLIDAGVDLVVGEGGYAAKEVEAYGRGVIAYSLGTLLRPPILSLAMRESTGLALRVDFVQTGAPHFEVFPLTFDDADEVALAEPATSSPSSATLELGDHLSSADARSLSDTGESLHLGSYRGPGTCLGPWEQRFFEQTAFVTRWFPETPSSTPLRPFASGFCGSTGYAVRRGVLSLGEFRRAIELDGGQAAGVELGFPAVALGSQIELTYGIPDDRLLSKFLPLHDETLAVKVGDAPPTLYALPYRAGWRTVSLDTTAMRGSAQTIRLTLNTNGTHFPVAIDARVTADHH